MVSGDPQSIVDEDLVRLTDATPQHLWEGAGASLQAAARSPVGVGAVVSRGGRPDLADEYLPRVEAPTLLIVGGNDLPIPYRTATIR